MKKKVVKRKKSRGRKLVKHVPHKLLKQFSSYESKVRRLKQLKEELNVLNPREFPQDVKVIESLLKDPSAIDKIQILIDNLRKKMIAIKSIEKLRNEIKILNKEKERINKEKEQINRNFINQVQEKYSKQLKSQKSKIQNHFEEKFKKLESKVEKRVRGKFEKILEKEKNSLLEIFDNNRKKLEENLKSQREKLSNERTAFNLEKSRVFEELQRKKQEVLIASRRLEKERDNLRKNLK